MTPSPRAAPGSPGDCRVCGAPDPAPWKIRSLDRELRSEDLRITDARYGTTLTLHRCRQCHFTQADGRELTQLEELYAALEDPSYELGETPRRLQMRWLLERARACRPKARTLLDVGAAAGLMLREAAARGFEAEGIEPSYALASAGRRAGMRIHQGVLPHPELRGRRFDVVTLVDVIEHVADPVGLLRAARDLVTDDGLVVVVTPDVGSLAARALGYRWWHFRLAHVGYFCRRSLHEAVKNSGLVSEREQSAKWFFEVGYLAERLEQYLPVAAINRFLRRRAGIRRVYGWIVPLDLLDSFAVFLRPSPRGVPL